MPPLSNLLSGIGQIVITDPDMKVQKTVALEIKEALSPRADIIIENSEILSKTGTLRLRVEKDAKSAEKIDLSLRGRKDWMHLKVSENSNIDLAASREHLLYLLFTILSEDLINSQSTDFNRGKVITPAFSNLRPVYDIFLTQHARTVRNFNRKLHIKKLARLGFSHVEVNGLAFPLPVETGPPGEVLHRFYTYCPSLDQFVTSKLNRGFYNQDYLQANLNFMKENAATAEEYGLKPGLVCFEPRSVPDRLLEKYPMLRGARVDHPFRSFHPRYNLSVGHPRVLEHYAEMMENLMKEVPALDYISIWSNDSGAGFEYTNSLYVGRNGGGYVIREWKGDREIAEAAAHNIIRFLRTLSGAARKINPNFRTLLRLEPFWTEYDYLWKEFGNGIDVEVSSLLTKGWGLPYKHPKYPEVKEIHMTALHNKFIPDEKEKIAQLREKRSDADVYFAPAALSNHEPLIGIPFPWLISDKLNMMEQQGVTTACSSGSVPPSNQVPYDVNGEVIRSFQIGVRTDIEDLLEKTAVRWIGDALADDLVQVWRHSDEAFRRFPVPIWIYSSWGVWYRLFTRPIVPDIEKISEKDRKYYEQFLLAPPHNRARVDFRYDVGFDLLEPSHAFWCVDVIDKDLLPEIEKALVLAGKIKSLARNDMEKKCAVDIHDRMTALKCWYRNQRNVAAWVAGVHGYLETNDPTIKTKCRKLLHDMVIDEIENTKDLLHLWETSKTVWMIISGVGETTFIYYKNMGEHLKRKIYLMEGRQDDEPYVDPNFQWRVPGLED